jgi:2-C-methyl-D-erythritol 4-phosphate cytidylyltransferase
VRAVAVAVIVAAGRGERLGSGEPKALVALAGRTMLEYSVRALRSLEAVRSIVVALPAGHLEQAPSGTVAVEGGAVRSESVRRALAVAGAADAVLVHDAARPLASPELFARVLAELHASGADAVIAALPVTDTIKQVAADGSTVHRTLDRATLWAVQTPQAFRLAKLREVLSSADSETLARATDDAWLIERAGGTVRVLAGESTNLKVTTPADLRLAEQLLAQRPGSVA